MQRSARHEVGRAACVCAALWFMPSALALADASKSAEKLGTGLGYGGAYLFGLAAGIAMFGIRYALDVRRAHLATYGK